MFALISMFVPGRGKRIQKKGDTTTGRIVGIQVREIDSESGSTEERYAIEVNAPQPVVLGVRQRLHPLEPVRLGMEVPLWHHKGNIVIDWKSTVGGSNNLAKWKSLRRPPEVGVVDKSLFLGHAEKRGAPATVTIRSAEVRAGRLGVRKGGLYVKVSVEAEGSAPYDVELSRVNVPFYASHLCDPETRLPAFVRRGKPDEVSINWPAAAMADPGIGRPTSAVLDQAPTLGMSSDEGAEQPTGGMGGMGAAPAPTVDTSGPGLEPIEGVDFDRWIQIQAALQRDRVSPKKYDEYTATYGLAPGVWLTVDRCWQMRLMRSPKLGPAYGAAMEAAQKKQ